MDNRGRSYENALFQFCGPYKFGGPCMGDGTFVDIFQGLIIQN